MSSRMNMKSALLALAVVVAFPVSQMKAAEGLAPMNAVITVLKNHPYLASSIAAFCFAAHCDINTKKNAEYSMDDLPADIKEMLQARIINGDILSKLISLVRKYGFGLKVKFYTMDIPERDEDGVKTGTINKGKKVLAQKPFGLYGNFDAYVLSQLEAFSKYIPTIAVIYLLLNNPAQSFEHAAAKAAK